MTKLIQSSLSLLVSLFVAGSSTRTTVVAFIGHANQYKNILLLPPSSTTNKPGTKLYNDLWGEPPKKDGDENERSIAIPFAPRPKLLDGTLPGDVGFDPFGLAGSDKASLYYMREAEIKHCRLAMLAAVGWPIAELFDKPIAETLHLPIALTKTGSSPSILNGGLDKIDIAYWMAVIALAGIIEIENAKVRDEKGAKYIFGDCNFDPLGLMPKKSNEQFIMQTKEIKNGRLAMLAIVGFAIQEALYRVPVVSETPIFFKPVLLGNY